MVVAEAPAMLEFDFLVWDILLLWYILAMVRDVKPSIIHIVATLVGVQTQTHVCKSVSSLWNLSILTAVGLPCRGQTTLYIHFRRLLVQFRTR